MKYILDSAVITAPGLFEYKHIVLAEAVDWLDERGWESTIEDPETAGALQRISGFVIPVWSRTEEIVMQSGDEALVFRLVFPQGYHPDPDPAQKDVMGLKFILENCKIGLLRREL